MIEIIGVTKVFGNKTAVDNLTFTVADGYAYMSKDFM